MSVVIYEQPLILVETGGRTGSETGLPHANPPTMLSRVVYKDLKTFFKQKNYCRAQRKRSLPKSLY